MKEQRPLIPILNLQSEADKKSIDALLRELRLDPADLALSRGARAKVGQTVHEILADVAMRGDDAVAELSQKIDDPAFTAAQIRVSTQEMRAAVNRVAPQQMDALRRSISQVCEYQAHIMPKAPPPLERPGVELGLRFTPLDSAGIYFPGGKASYPSSLVMLAVPAQVAGVKRLVVCTPPSTYGRSDLVLAACYELGLTDVFRAGGAAAVAAMAFGTATIPAVDKIVGPGNLYVQLAKRVLAGCVGIDGFLGPSEILTIADDSGHADFIASDLVAQAEHDPGSCFLLTTSQALAEAVRSQLGAILRLRRRSEAIARALSQSSAIIISESMDALVELANQFAAEHVNLQTRDNDAILGRLRHAGAIFVGPYSPVAAGDYVAGPSHCLPTNTTARFSSGISVYEFLKRTGTARYEPDGLAADAQAIITLAEAEQLDGHAASVRIRTEKKE